MSTETDDRPARYHDRQHLDLPAAPPQLKEAFEQLFVAVFLAGTVPVELKNMVFTVASLAAGCRHCQAHGAYGLALTGTPTERIAALWSFETSEHFNDAERAALRLALAGGSVPNGSTPELISEVRRHWTDPEIIELVAVISIAGYLNRWNDTIATVTDQESVNWATEHLGAVGWRIGKHAGTTDEQREAHPLRKWR